MKSLDFNMVKVKGHSGVKYNDKADLIAKKAAVQVINGTLSVVNLLDNEVGHRINFNLTWNNVVIDCNLHKFNKIVSNSIANSHWSLASIWDSPAWNDTWTNKAKQNTYAWHLWWQLIKNINNFHC